jgi:hypothetical protein
MRINGIEGLTKDEITRELQSGGKFVIFQYCISIIILTFRRSSDVYFIKSSEGTFGKSLFYTLISLLLGWWGIPWGPIYTISSLATNLTGGKDVTQELFAVWNASPKVS